MQPDVPVRDDRQRQASPPEGAQLLLETADGDRRSLWLAAGKLRSTAGETLGSASTTGSAALATAAGSVLITGGAGGTVVWRRTADNSELVRLQLVAGGAVAVSADGRFELLGDIERPADYVFCRAASYPVPYALCAERLRTPGLLAATLRK